MQVPNPCEAGDPSQGEAGRASVTLLTLETSKVLGGDPPCEQAMLRSQRLKVGVAVESVGRIQNPILVQVRADSVLPAERSRLSFEAES